MPRRGGRRAGAPGVAYGERTDLNAQRVLPAAVVPGQQYGQGVAQQQAQQAVPMATPPMPATSAPPAGMQPGPPAPGAGPLPFDRPTERPSEPVTAGLPVGAGPGPEALGLHPQIEPGAGSLSAILGQVAAQSGSTDLAFLAQRARNLGQ